MKKNEMFLTYFEDYKKKLIKGKEIGLCEDDLRDIYQEARGFLVGVLALNAIETGNGENGFLTYNNILSEIYYKDLF